MNKGEVVTAVYSFLDEYTFIKSTDLVVGHGSALVIYGLKDNTEDVDVTVNAPIFKQLRTMNLKEIKRTSSGAEVLIMDNHPFVEIHEGEETDVEMIEGVLVTTKKRILEEKRQLNRPKDQQWIRLLEKIVESKHDSFFNRIRLYSTRSEDVDREDYRRYLAHLGLTPYLQKLVIRYDIHVPNKAVWDEKTLLKIAIQEVRRNYLYDPTRVRRIESMLRKYHQATIRNAYRIVAKDMIGRY